MQKDRDAIEQTLTELVVYSEGVISWTDAWLLSPQERETFIKTLNKFMKEKAGKKADEYL